MIWRQRALDEAPVKTAQARLGIELTTTLHDVRKGKSEAEGSGIHGRGLVWRRVFASCQLSQYGDCHVNMTYPGLVPSLRDGEVTETVIMGTGAAPVDVDEPQKIKCPGRVEERTITRITGTEWQENDQAYAQTLWEMGREKGPALFARFGKWAGLF